MSHLDDLAMLPAEVRNSARVDGDEVAWHISDALAAIESLTGAGRIVLGLDLREYDDDGNVFEAPWSSYDGADPRGSRNAAMEALAREGRDQFGDWVLVTWTR